MPRGGSRPGAGRPRSPNTIPRLTRRQIAAEAAEAGIDPLSFMLLVMNDETQPPGRRAAMAIAAAPYVHRKPERGST